MHAFFILLALLHATALAVIGFFVLFAASRSTGLLKTIGNMLGAWLFILALLAIVGAAFAPMMVHEPWGGGMMGPYGHAWMHQGPPIAATPSEAASATPAAPANK
jgi:hypothetical protein